MNAVQNNQVPIQHQIIAKQASLGLPNSLPVAIRFALIQREILSLMIRFQNQIFAMGVQVRFPAPGPGNDRLAHVQLVKVNQIQLGDLMLVASQDAVLAILGFGQIQEIAGIRFPVKGPNLTRLWLPGANLAAAVFWIQQDINQPLAVFEKITCG